MPRAQPSLGRVELELLQFLHRRPTVSAREVADEWAAPAGLSRTTVLTMLERLRTKGYVSRKKVEGLNRYSPRRDIASVLQTLVGDFVQGMLGGSVQPFVAFLQEQQQHLSADDLRELKAIVDQIQPGPASTPPNTASPALDKEPRP